MGKDEIVAYHETLAGHWHFWEMRNHYYRETVRAWIRGMVPPRSRIVDFGAGGGEFLASLQPEKGLGLNFSEYLSAVAAQRFPQLEFRSVAVDNIEMPKAWNPEFIIIGDLTKNVYDMWDMFARLRQNLRGDELVVIAANNPLWSSAARLGARLRLCPPGAPRTFVTSKDVRNVLELLGFDFMEDRWLTPLPIPLVNWLVNALVPEIPVVRYASFLRLMSARCRMPRPSLSCTVVIPCHNEEHSIASTIRRIPNVGVSTEIIVVDDGSSDGTRREAERIQKEDARVVLLSFDKNRGKARAVFAAFAIARGDVIVVLDADAAVDPEVLPNFFDAIASGNADFVNGTRLVYPMENRAMRVSNYIGNKMFCFLVSWIFGQRVSDTLCGTKAMLRRDFLRMPMSFVDRWGDFTLLFGAARLRLRIREIPVHYRERREGKSKMRAFIEVWKFLAACARGYVLLRFPRSSDFPEPPTQVATTDVRKLA